MIYLIIIKVLDEKRIDGARSQLRNERSKWCAASRARDDHFRSRKDLTLKLTSCLAAPQRHKPWVSIVYRTNMPSIERCLVSPLPCSGCRICILCRTPAPSKATNVKLL